MTIDRLRHFPNMPNMLVAVETVIFCALAWIALDLTRAYAGRTAAWALGSLILCAVVIALVRRKKVSSR
jgi:hypothetical protein